MSWRHLPVVDWLASPQRLPCLDLRSEAEFAGGHLPGAGNLPLAELEARRHELPRRGAPLYLVGGALVAAGARALAERGRWELAGSLEPPRAWPAAALVQDAPLPLWSPNPWLAAHWQALPPGGRVLDLAMGSGRNAVWLAQQGLRVHGVDILPEAVSMAAALARRHGVELAGRVEDARLPAALAPGDWDGLVVIDFLERALLARLAAALAPGGVLIYETFTREQARAGGKPRDARWLLEAGELRAAFAGALEILAAREGEVEPGRHVASLVARRHRRGPSPTAPKKGDASG